MTTLKNRMDKLPRARRNKVEARAAELIAEEMSLKDLRKALKQTQVSVARELGIKQENVSRIEKRTDLLISTLTSYVQAMGGKLHLVAQFPDRPPIELTSIAALGKKNRPSSELPVASRAPALAIIQPQGRKPLRWSPRNERSVALPANPAGREL